MYNMNNYWSPNAIRHITDNKNIYYYSDLL